MLEQQKSQVYLNIQALRGIAAMMVVVYHALSVAKLIPLSTGGLSPMEAGVDIFFVISGFVMVASTDKSNKGPLAFLRARLIRIVPIYWITLVLMLILIATHLRPISMPPFDEIIKSFLFIFYRGKASGEYMPIITVGWTLNYEMFFYFVFAATMVLGRTWQLVALGVLFAALVVLRKFVGDSGAIAFRLTSPLLFEFLFGMLLATYRREIAKVPAIAGFIMAAAAIALILGLSRFDGARFLTFGIPAAMIVGAAIILEKQKLSHAVLTTLGDASYAIYLIHGLVLILIAHFLLNVLMPGWLFVLALIASVGAGIFYHKLVERPVFEAMKNALKVKSTLFSDEKAP